MDATLKRLSLANIKTDFSSEIKTDVSPIDLGPSCIKLEIPPYFTTKTAFNEHTMDTSNELSNFLAPSLELRTPREHENNIEPRIENSVYEKKNERDEYKRNHDEFEEDEQDYDDRFDQYNRKVSNWEEDTESADFIIYSLKQSINDLTHKCSLLDGDINRERWNVVRVQTSLQMQVEIVTQAVQSLAYATEKKDELSREIVLLRKQNRELSQALNQMGSFGTVDYRSGQYSERGAKRRRPSNFQD